MAWTFGNDPVNSIRDRVRILIGDTDPSDPLIPDEQLDWIIEKEGRNETLAAATAAAALAAKFSRQASITVGELSVEYARLATQFWTLSQNLREQALKFESFGFPMLAREEPREPLFRLGQFDIGGTS